MRSVLIARICVTVAVALGSTFVAFAGSANFDLTFGSEGKVLFDQADRFSPPTLRQLVQDANGGLLVVSVDALWRVLANGTVDTTFAAGRGTAPAQALCGAEGDQQYCSLSRAAVQADGKIVVAFSSISAAGGSSVARLMPDGVLDTSFGHRGVATLAYGPGAEFESISGVVVQADGGIVLAGQVERSAGVRLLSLLRFLPNGVPDIRFGIGGRVVSEVEAQALDFTQQPDGKLVVAGFIFPRPNQNLARTVVARFRPSLAPDLSFGQGGIYQQDFSEPLIPTALLVQPDGKLVLAGNSLSTARNFTFCACSRAARPTVHLGLRGR